MIKESPGTGLLPSEDSFSVLMEEVCRQRMDPEDQYEIAAILESFGWNDRMASETFGVADVFELSAQLLEAIRKKVLFVPYTFIKRPSLIQYTITLIRGFFRGAIFALPMVVSVVAMLTLRFSLWSYMYLSLDKATSIAIGTILSFVAIGGFTQTIGFWGFRFIQQGQYYMARKIVFYYVKIGIGLCLVIAVGMLLFNGVFAVFPWSMALIADLYFLFLSAIWLSVTVMYILQKELTFTGLIIGGIFLVFILFRVLKVNIIESQIISLLAVAVVGIIASSFFFYQAEKKGEQGINPPLPKLSVIYNISMPYFAYGFMYFTFLFIDRVMAWSTNNTFMPFLIWFRGDYELGLDFALAVLILPMGLVEVVVTDLMINLEANQKNHRIFEIQALKDLYQKSYLKRLIYLAVFSSVNALVWYFVIQFLNKGLILGQPLFTNDVTNFVLLYALVSYALISIGLMNALILFCFSQPGLIFRPILFAALTNLGVGFLLSRWVHYSWAVIGLLVGSIVFSVWSSVQVRKMFGNLDYYLYSAM